MPITPCFDPTTGASGGAPSGGGASEPGLTVTGRADGEAYNVSAGARSLSISNPDGATLSTTVEQASTGAAITVTGSTGTTPSWTAPSGSTTGEAVQVRVKATKGGLSTSVGFTERVAGAGGSGSWSTKGTHDITGAANAGPYTSGAQTVDATGGDITMTATRASGNSGNVTITNGTGAVITAVGGSGAMTATFNLGAALSGYDFEYIRFYAIAVDVYLTNITFDDDGSIAQIAISDNTAWNDGDGRGLELYQADASDEQRRIRGAGSTTTIDTRTKVTERVVTLVMTRGQIVDFADTSGTSAPADPHTATLFTAGGDAVPRNDDTPLYISNFFCNVTAFGGAALTCTKIVIRRFQ
jgi:hypothetical protein